MVYCNIQFPNKCATVQQQLKEEKKQLLCNRSILEHKFKNVHNKLLLLITTSSFTSVGESPSTILYNCGLKNLILVSFFTYLVTAKYDSFTWSFCLLFGWKILGPVSQPCCAQLGRYPILEGTAVGILKQQYMVSSRLISYGGC